MPTDSIGCAVNNLLGYPIYQQWVRLGWLCQVSRCHQGQSGLLCRLVMGTRCGDLDPAVVLYIQKATGRSSKDMDKLFNKESGLLGLAGKSDVRAILEESASGDDRSNLALDVGSLLLPLPACQLLCCRELNCDLLACLQQCCHCSDKWATNRSAILRMLFFLQKTYSRNSPTAF